jgi:hypothetical protein
MCFTLFRKKYYHNKIIHYDDIITHYICNAISLRLIILQI